jgi:hypothetical protein
MPKPKTTLILNPKPQSQITLSEYVTAIAWSPNNKYSLPSVELYTKARIIDEQGRAIKSNKL